MNTYQIDTEIGLTGMFADQNGVATDPDVVELYVKTPDGVVTVYSGSQLIRTGPGVYTKTLLTNQSGRWVYKWQGQGALNATSPDVFFNVAPSKILSN